MKYQVLGFTLAELLIALAILGVIAAFTIPKVLQSQQDQKQKAVVKETIAMLENIAWQSRVDREQEGIPWGCPDHINAIKICPSDSLSEGCWTASMAATGEANERGFVLANGAYITGVCANIIGGDGLAMDWNGPDPPNTFGEDTYQLAMCLDPDPGDCGSTQFGQMFKTADYVRAFE